LQGVKEFLIILANEKIKHNSVGLLFSAKCLVNVFFDFVETLVFLSLFVNHVSILFFTITMKIK